LKTFQSFLGDLNENKSPPNPVLSKVKRGPVLSVVLALAQKMLKGNIRNVFGAGVQGK
jgi:hypothetical protein